MSDARATEPMQGRAGVTDDTPLRLAIAAGLAFPDGSMGVSGLRREALRGNLAVEKIAGRHYTTLRAIREMRDRCRVQPKAPASTTMNGKAGKPSGSSATEKSGVALAALLQTAERLSKRSNTTSPKSTSPSSSVVTLPSRTSS